MAQDDVTLHHKQQLILRAGAKATILCLVVFALFYGSAGWFSWPGDPSAAQAFALRADLLIVLWLAIAIGRVSRSRRHSIIDIDAALSDKQSRKVAIDAAFLQNTLEQAVLAIPTHLAFATLSPGPALSLLPAAIVLFCAGRILFWRGYEGGAEGRSFGMVTTTIPTLLLLAASIVLAAKSILSG